MRCDLHVHSFYSGMCTVPGLQHICRECYSHPEEVYHTLKARGMDLVTVTDHDSIDAAEHLRRYPDFFLSEEVTCHLPSGTEIHVGVYDIDERHHLALQARRDDLPRLLAYLNEQDLFFSINHLFSALTGRREAIDFESIARHFPACEVKNGQVPGFNNRQAARWAEQARKAPVAGSDGHSLRALGKTGIVVPHAATRQEFLRCLRAGAAFPFGEDGNIAKLTLEILSVGMSMMRHKPLTSLLLPLAAATPLFGLANFLWELRFARHWERRLRLSSPPPARASAAPAQAQNPGFAPGENTPAWN